MSNLTPLLLMAGLGMADKKGLAPNKHLSDAADQFSTAGISGAVQSNFANYTPEVQDIVLQIPPFMTGLSPGGGTPDNIIGSVKSSSIDLFANGIPGFAVILSQAGTFAATAFAFHGAAAQSKGQSFNDLGFSFNNFNDVASGGVTSQFSPATAGLVASELPNLGSMFGSSDLMNLHNPGTLASNLINQGLGDAGGLTAKLSAQGVALDDLPNADPVVVSNVLKTIDGNALKDIVDGTNFAPHNINGIQTLNDVFDVNNLFSPGLATSVGSLDNLSNKLSNVGGSFQSFDEVASLYGSIDRGSFPKLAELSTPLPDSFTANIGDTLGRGGGIFGNPTVIDIIGSAAGLGYIDDINSCTGSQTDLINSDSDVKALADYIRNNTDPDPAVLQQLVDTVNQKPSLQDTINAANEKIMKLGSQLANEKKNQELAGIDPKKLPTGSALSVLNLAQAIPGMSLDPMSLGFAPILDKLATPDVYGQAIQASLIEGKNLTRLQAFGIDPGTKMDPMVYAKQLSSIRG